MTHPFQDIHQKVRRVSQVQNLFQLEIFPSDCLCLPYNVLAIPLTS